MQWEMIGIYARVSICFKLPKACGVFISIGLTLKWHWLAYTRSHHANLTGNILSKLISCTFLWYNGVLCWSMHAYIAVTCQFMVHRRNFLTLHPIKCLKCWLQWLHLVCGSHTTEECSRVSLTYIWDYHLIVGWLLLEVAIVILQ